MRTKMIPLLAGLLFVASTLKAQQPPPMQPPSPEMRLNHVSERLDKDLALKPNQKQKVLDAYKAFFKDMDKLRGGNPPPPPPPPGKKEDVDKLVKARDESIKKALTDEQFKKYQEIEKTIRPPGRGPNGGPGGPPPPPQG